VCVLMEQWLGVRLNGTVGGVRLNGAVARCAS